MTKDTRILCLWVVGGERRICAASGGASWFAIIKSHIKELLLTESIVRERWLSLISICGAIVLSAQSALFAVGA